VVRVAVVSDAQLTAARLEVARRLSELQGQQWQATDRAVLGPGTFAVAVEWASHGEDRHIDPGFVWNRENPDVPVTWDCAAGWGDSDAERAANGIDVWIRTTAPALLEVLAQDGSFAEHLPPGDEMGLPNWHVVHGPIAGMGATEGVRRLQQWVIDHPLLPALADEVIRDLDRPYLNGVKFIFGSSSDGDIAEVRINSMHSKSASESLRRLTWPRSRQMSWVRTFVVLLHED